MLNLRTRLLLLQFLTVVITALLLSIGSSLLFVSSHEKLQKRHLIHLAKEGARETATFLQNLSRHVSGFAEKSLSRAEALSHLIDDLLSIRRIESGQPLIMEIAPTDIALVLEQVVKQFRLTSESHRYELSLQPVSGEVIAQVDASRLQQVLENLLSNAVKYSEAGSLVCIRGENGQGFYRIVVEDEGIGMAPEQVERIFEQFYRVDYSNTKTSGLGIGMSIVKQIIEGHGGQIQIDSQLGKGTRVEISLP